MKMVTGLLVLVALAGSINCGISGNSYAGPGSIPAQNSNIVGILDRITLEKLATDLKGISGVSAVTVGGASYAITTRNTASGKVITNAAQYVCERFQAAGLTASYQNWTNGSYSSRNVMGAKTGTMKSDEIVIVCAHVDDLPASGKAPGADDNGSGVVAVLNLADAMMDYTFQRTIRFVLFTGEEQGYLGSAAYVSSIAGQNVVALLNLDGIGYDSFDGPIMRLKTRTTGAAGYSGDRAVADAFVRAVSTYGISLTPIIDTDGFSHSDHFSFWSDGFAAVLVTEDAPDADMNYAYHTTGDDVTVINYTYLTNMTKAAAATVATEATPVSGPGSNFFFTDLVTGQAQMNSGSTHATNGGAYVPMDNNPHQ